MDEPSERPKSVGSVLASCVLSYALAAVLLLTLVFHAGIWNVLANTRALDLLIKLGIVRYHDENQGIIHGLDSHEYYLFSQDAIDYRLVVLAALIYFFYWGLKAVQYQGIARFVGMRGTSAQHMRAWIYGDGLGRVIPFRFSETATATALEAQGEDPRRVRQSFAVMDFLVVAFEILLFWFFGLWITNYSLWFVQSFAALCVLLVVWLLARGTGIGKPSFWRSHMQTCRALSDRPGTFAKLGALSVIAMLADDLTPFILAMAFTGKFVFLSVAFIIVQSGVVAGYIAKQINLTPHGIGVFEWCFALALNYSGLGMPEAATIALLDMVLRHSTGFLVWLAVVLRHNVGTNWQAVMARFRGVRAGVEA